MYDIIPIIIKNTQEVYKFNIKNIHLYYRTIHCIIMAPKANKKTKATPASKRTKQTKAKKTAKAQVAPQTLDEVVNKKFKVGPIRSIMASAGMKRTNSKSFAVIREHMQRYLTSLLQDAHAVMVSTKRNTIGSDELNQVLAARGYDLTCEQVAEHLAGAKGTEEKVLFIASANADSVVRKITEGVEFTENGKKPRFGNDVIACAQYYLEQEVRRLVRSVLDVTGHSERKTIKADDVQLVLQIESRLAETVHVQQARLLELEKELESRDARILKLEEKLEKSREKPKSKSKSKSNV